MLFRNPESQKPLRRPVAHIVPAGSNEVVSFVNSFLGFATDIIITNLDSTNIATFQINGEGNPILTLSSGAERSITDTKIEQIKIVSGASGGVQIEAQIKEIEVR